MRAELETIALVIRAGRSYKLGVMEKMSTGVCLFLFASNELMN